MNIGRCRRAFSARSTAPRPMIGRRAGGAGHDDVELVQHAAAGRPGAAPAAPKRLASFSPRSSVRLATAMRLGLARRKVRGHQFDHLAGADEQHADLAQVLEQLRGQPHRGRGHADRVAADLGGRCAPPWPPRTSAGTAGAACVPSVPADSASRTACFIWPRICGSPSTIESRPDGHAEGMPRRGAVFQHVGVVEHALAADAALRRQPVDGRAHQVAGLAVLGGDVQLGAVAGGQQRRLGLVVRPDALAKAVQRRRQLLRRERKPAAQVERRGRCGSGPGR